MGIVNGIADLIGLKDRHQLDHALAVLLRSLLGEQGRTVAVLRRVRTETSEAIEPGGLDERWLTCAHLLHDPDLPDQAMPWLAPAQLPRLDDFALRLQCMALRQVVATQPATGALTTTVFPIFDALDVNGVLEVESTQALPDSVQAEITALLRVYKNFRSLLDYGERDTLTDLLNRKTFESSFLAAMLENDGAQDDYQNSRRTTTQVGGHWLAMIDIDHFKRVNDNHGHLIGDEVLLLMAGLMRGNFRFHDQLYRFGGEEFVVLLRHATLAQASQVFERLRANTQAHLFPQVGSITISIGYTALRPGDTPDVAFARADKAVYYAKGHGRNQSCHFEALVAQGELADEVANVGDIELF